MNRRASSQTHAGQYRTLGHIAKSRHSDRANAELHVVVVTAGCCNPSALSRAVGDERYRTPATAQLFRLLDCLSGYARALGIQLTVFDVPLAR